MWPAALEATPVHAPLSGATELRQRALRLWGTSESDSLATRAWSSANMRTLGE